MMRKFFSIILFCSCGAYAQGQSWTKDLDKKPVKMQDIIAEYEKSKANPVYHTEENESAEKEDYHFDRWKWYWEQHTDVNGYLVSPMRKLQEWNKIRAKKLQQQLKTTANKSSWVFSGPDKSNGGYSGIGRINVIAFHPTDTNTFWIGSAGGGVWKTTNGGLAWTSLGDQFPVMGVSDIDFNPLNPNTVYLCTGDRDAGDTYSVGVLKSTDGGATWDTTGLQWPPNAFRLAGSLVVNRIDTNSITLASTGGIYKSYDGGAKWTQTSGGEFKQVVYHPTDTAILFATGFTTGTHQVFRSVNGGATWTQQSSFPANTRVTIAVTPANVAIVKAVVSNSANGLEGIYNSTDTGKTFTRIYSATGTNCDGNILVGNPNANACGGQGWYDLTMAISPVDEQKVIVGGVNTWYSTNGGTSWTIANQWQTTLPGVQVVHADKHFHMYHPLMTNILFEGCDGGIYKTPNPLSGLWTDLSNGLGITQFYRNAVSNVAGYVVGGAQDNGSKRLSGTSYSDLTGGDGMNCEMDPINNTVFYTSIQYGELRRTINTGSNFTDISNNIPGGQPKGDWITPFAIHPLSTNIIAAGYNYVYMTEDRGNTWKAISPNFFSNAKRICFTISGDEHIYLIVNNFVQKTTNLGTNWAAIINKPIGDISDITADRKNPDRIWITYSGYATNATDGRVAEYTPDSGWMLRNENLPNIPIYCIVQDTADGTLYVGTDFGVYYRDTTMTQWEQYNAGLPNIEVTDLGINYTTNEIWASTYGRGMWKSPRNGEPVNVKTTIPYTNDMMRIYPNPNYGKFTIHTTDKTLQNRNLLVRIINVTGATAWQKTMNISADGKTEINADIPRGTYIVELTDNNSVIAKSRMITY